MDIKKPTPKYRGLCAFNTQVGSSEAKCARNKLGEISEGGQIHILKCIKRASPVFWRLKNKKLFNCIISTIPDSHNEHFSFNTLFVPWCSYLLWCLNSAFAEASLVEKYNTVCSFKWIPFFLSLENWTSKIYNRLWKNDAELAILFLKESGPKWPQSSVNEVNINPDVQAFLQNTPLTLVKNFEDCTNFPQITEANKNKHTYNQIQP